MKDAMTSRTAKFLAIAAFSLLFWGCKGSSSSTPSRFFSPDYLAIAPNPEDPAMEIIYAGNPFTGPTQVTGMGPSNGTITLVDLPSERPRSTPILIGGILQDICVSKDGRSLFVTKLDRPDEGFFVAYDAGGGFTELVRMPIEGTPGKIAVSPSGDAIYLLAAGSGTSGTGQLLVFSSTTFSQTAQVPLAFTPTVLGVSPTGAILVGNPVSGTIEYFSSPASTPVSIDIGGRAGGMSFSPDGSVAYATVSSKEMVVAIDLAGTMATSSSIILNGVPEGIAVSLTTSTIVFVANTNGQFSAVNFVTGKADAILSMTGIPRKIVLSDERAYVSNSINNSIVVFDVEKYKELKEIQ